MTLFDRINFKLFRFFPSYSQSGEDRIISLLLQYLKKTKISYLDIGTNHPKIFNNTYLFYREKNSGVCVEPNPILCKSIKKARPRDLCLNIGIGTKNIEGLDFFVMETDTLSTFSAEAAKQLDANNGYKIKEIIKVPMLNFNELLDQHFIEVPDVVSIDVEDLNEEIVLSINFTRRPLIFCVETIVFDPDSKGNKKLNSINKHFLDNNYIVWADTNINTIFVDNQFMQSFYLNN